MNLKFYLNAEGKRVYTLSKIYIDEEGVEKETLSAHPARFSPEDKNSFYRIKIKERFGLLPTQQPPPRY